MADRIESIITDCPADSESEVRDIDKDKYTEQFRPKGYARTATVKEISDPTGDNYSASNN